MNVLLIHPIHPPPLSLSLSLSLSQCIIAFDAADTKLHVHVPCRIAESTRLRPPPPLPFKD